MSKATHKRELKQELDAVMAEIEVLKKQQAKTYSFVKDFRVSSERAQSAIDELQSIKTKLSNRMTKAAKLDETIRNL